MKKFLISILLLLILVSQSSAMERGLLTNLWSSWVSVTSTPTTVSLPYTSRDVTIQNGAAVPVCVSLKGDAITGTCASTAGTPTPINIYQQPATSSTTFFDFATTSIQFRAASTTASPVSVIITY